MSTAERISNQPQYFVETAGLDREELLLAMEKTRLIPSDTQENRIGRIYPYQIWSGEMGDYHNVGAANVIETPYRVGNHELSQLIIQEVGIRDPLYDHLFLASTLKALAEQVEDGQFAAVRRIFGPQGNRSARIAMELSILEESLHPDAPNRIIPKGWLAGYVLGVGEPTFMAEDIAPYLRSHDTAVEHFFQRIH